MNFWLDRKNVADKTKYESKYISLIELPFINNKLARIFIDKLKNKLNNKKSI